MSLLKSFWDEVLHVPLVMGGVIFFGLLIASMFAAPTPQPISLAADAWVCTASATHWEHGKPFVRCDEWKRKRK